jgi:hypothetical protein
MNMSDVQKEIASVEEFEKTLTFESPIPVSWAVWKYKAQQELIERLQEREFNHYPIVIHDLESRIFAQQDLIAQKDAEIARLREQIENSKLTPMQKMFRSMDILSQLKKEESR